ncbi:hypothetical protein [Cupriavidus metallidurans]|uniref:hypothetical protein n=1 Tax=Cupriavidus metallidurans TaxID=119219 RepID=UPI001CCFC095|nr:hypothetical protein [Cupriavidus metallidurans]UBM12820.1 hypothetical protein LAI70_28105 [Cupriavidus metallidurans]
MSDIKRAATASAMRTLHVVFRQGPEWNVAVEGWLDQKTAQRRAGELEKAKNKLDVLEHLSSYVVTPIKIMDAPPRSQGGALTDEQIIAAAKPSGFDFNEAQDCLEAEGGHLVRIDALRDIVQRILVQSAPSAPQQAGDGLTDRIREAIARGLGASRIDEHYDTDPIVNDIARRIGGVIGAPVASRAEFMTTSELEEIARENAIHAALDRLLHSDDLMDGISAVRGMLANPPAAPRQPGEMGAGCGAHTVEAQRLRQAL